MLKKMIVKENQIKLYKSDTYLKPGEYFVKFGGVDKKKRMMAGGKAVMIKGVFCWVFPAEKYVQRIFFNYIPPERSLYGQAKEFDMKLWDKINFDFSILHTWQKNFLLDFQYFCLNGKQYRRGLIARMGGGKTLTGLLMCAMFNDPVVAAPGYLHAVWKEEAKKWGLPLPNITTYQGISKVKKADFLVVDEANAVSNPNAQRTKAMVDFSKKLLGCVTMTGTPLSVSPQQIRWVNVSQPGVLPNDDNAFKHLYGVDTALEEVIPGRKVWVVSTWNLPKLTEHIKDYIQTVDISDLLASLKPIEYKIIETKKPRHYDMLAAGAGTTKNKSKLRSQLLMASDGHFYNDDNEIIDLDNNKINSLKDIIRSLGEPIFVVAHWTATIEKLKRELEEFNPACIDDEMGSTLALQKFKSGLTNVLICPFEKTKGLNLQEHCRITAVISNGTSPLMREQMIARTFRPGQKKGVIIMDFCAKGTLDQKRLELLNKHADENEEFVSEALDKEIERKYKKTL